MRTRPFVFALCLPLLTAGSVFAPVNADEGQNPNLSCSGLPSEAVTQLPSAADKWAQIICTPKGEVLAARDGWIWFDPEDHAYVAISSQAPTHALAPTAERTNDRSYFTKVALTRATGEDFDRAYDTFHEGFDPNDGKPAGYRMDVTTRSGKSLQIYFFDYINYGWGIVCEDGACVRDTRFLVVDMEKGITPLGPSI